MPVFLEVGDALQWQIQGWALASPFQHLNPQVYFLY
jgi:hypothetical protein